MDVMDARAPVGKSSMIADIYGAPSGGSAFAFSATGCPNDRR